MYKAFETVLNISSRDEEKLLKEREDTFSYTSRKYIQSEKKVLENIHIAKAVCQKFKTCVFSNLLIKVYKMFLRIPNNKYYLIIFFNGFIQEYILNVVPCSTMSSSIFRSKKNPLIYSMEQKKDL